MEWLFLALMIFGLAYLVLMIVSGIGDLMPIDVDGMLEGTGIDSLMGLEGAEDASGLGCSVIAAFLAGFGAVGLTGTVMAWNPLLMLLVATGFGWGLGRVVVAIMSFVFRQQSTEVFHKDDLIGLSARVTIDTAAGKTGEAMVESGAIRKYPVQEVNGAALQRGNTVVIVDVNGPFLQVKKKWS
jgi:hypothetical protein